MTQDASDMSKGLNPPMASEFFVGQQVVAHKEISPKIPKGTRGYVEDIQAETNLLTINWNIPTWPYIKITVGSPTLGIGRELE